MVYEGNQAKNFIKQFLKYGRHLEQAGKKLDKRVKFVVQTKNLTKVLSKMLFNISSPCFENLHTYHHLADCPAMINEKCNVTLPDDTMMAGMEKCNQNMTKIQNITESNKGKEIEYSKITF